MATPMDIYNKVDRIPNIPSPEDYFIPTQTGVKDIFSHLQGGGSAFRNPVTSDINSNLAMIKEIRNDPIHVSDPALQTALTKAETGLNSFQAHTDSSVSGLRQNFSPVISLLRVRQSVGPGLSAQNPCNSLNNLYGSLLGLGLLLLAALAAALISLIPENILKAIDDILTMILKEAAAINALLSELSNFALASLLAGLADDPCAQALLNAVGAQDVLNSLPQLPKF